MPQQVSLTGSIPLAQYALAVSTLEAYTGMRPAPVGTHTLVAQPYLRYFPKAEAGKVNQIEMYKLRVVREWAPLEAAERNGIIHTHSVVHHEELGLHTWTLVVADIPLAGRRSTTLQAVYESTITHGNVLPYLTVLGYTMASEFWVRGVRFFHGDVVIELTRVYVGDSAESSEDEVPLALLDVTGGYMVRAYVNVARTTDVDGLARADSALVALQAELAGLVKLGMVERGSMDGRVKPAAVGTA